MFSNSPWHHSSNIKLYEFILSFSTKTLFNVDLIARARLQSALNSDKKVAKYDQENSKIEALET